MSISRLDTILIRLALVGAVALMPLMTVADAAVAPKVVVAEKISVDLKLLPFVEDVDVLHLDDNVKAILDQSIVGISSKRERATTLHLLLFNSSYLGIDYGGGLTKTAQQTYDTRSGNCISLASLYVAAARYVGLKAKFQNVDVPREWYDEESFYIVPSHVNVAVNISGMGRELIVEFTDIYSAQNTRFYDSQVISDERVLAEYYNNIGMEFMQQGQYELAIANLKKSINTYPKVGFVWSNLGVLYKTAGFFDLAESAYKKSLKLEKKNLSTLNNLYALYRQLGRDKDADKLAKKVDHYSRKNPHYLVKLAESEMALGNYKQAITLLKKAIKYKPEEHRFHLVLASAHFSLGEYSKSISEVSIASQSATTDLDKSRFQRKLAYIQKHQNL